MKKKYILWLLAFVLLISLTIISSKEEKYDIKDINYLWEIYDQNMNDIKKNMDYITYDTEEWMWWELKDFVIEDFEYQQSLNRLVSDIRLCYYELLEVEEYSAEKYNLLPYRDKKNIIDKELVLLIEQVNNNQDTNFERFKNNSFFLISMNEESSKRYTEIVNIYENIKKTELFSKNVSSYEEILIRRIIKSNILKNLSDFLLVEYYRLK
jgi:hypothetical protein